MPLSEQDKAIVRMSLAGVEVEELPTIRKIHEEACRRLPHRGSRAYRMHAYALEVIAVILEPPEDEDPAEIRAAFDVGPHGVTAPPQELG